MQVGIVCNENIGMDWEEMQYLRLVDIAHHLDKLGLELDMFISKKKKQQENAK